MLRLLTHMCGVFLHLEGFPSFLCYNVVPFFNNIYPQAFNFTHTILSYILHFSSSTLMDVDEIDFFLSCLFGQESYRPLTFLVSSGIPNIFQGLPFQVTIRLSRMRCVQPLVTRSS